MITKKLIERKIVFYEIVGFAFVAFLLWADEIFDIPHTVFQAPATPVNWVESVVETIYVIILGAIIILITWRDLKKIKYLEGFLPVCSFCKRIRVGNDWIPIEEYLSEHSEAVLSHGFCPECTIKNFGKIL
ncbi:hypothetical protein LLG96_14770 [bacterium]|nr:hypothetical protein [bacterium]